MIPKFRAWDKRRKEMWKVATLHIEDEYADLFKTNIYEKPFDNPWAKFEDLILMQSTGLKDKNGVEIYVGDIVRNDKGEIGRVVYLKQEAGFVVALPKSDYRLGHRNTGEPYDVASGHEVIGNIYANPELLSSVIE